MVIFQYNLYIFGIHLRTMLYPKLCYNELCYKEVEVYKEISSQKCAWDTHYKGLCKALQTSMYLQYIYNYVFFEKQEKCQYNFVNPF